MTSKRRLDEHTSRDEFSFEGRDPKDEPYTLDLDGETSGIAREEALDCELMMERMKILYDRLTEQDSSATKTSPGLDGSPARRLRLAE